jgi:hypothetical protein
VTVCAHVIGDLYYVGISKRGIEYEYFIDIDKKEIIRK